MQNNTEMRRGPRTKTMRPSIPSDLTSDQKIAWTVNTMPFARHGRRGPGELDRDLTGSEGPGPALQTSDA